MYVFFKQHNQINCIRNYYFRTRIVLSNTTCTFF